MDQDLDPSLVGTCSKTTNPTPVTYLVTCRSQHSVSSSRRQSPYLSGREICSDEPDIW